MDAQFGEQILKLLEMQKEISEGRASDLQNQIFELFDVVDANKNITANKAELFVLTYIVGKLGLLVAALTNLSGEPITSKSLLQLAEDAKSQLAPEVREHSEYPISLLSTIWKEEQ
ncbi:hypothetical protein AMST5_01457 [freshwater sediment metagenome]|uniref:Uncharacterized protein n=1 Tax=freshwater sediment metagenome TaxID=556182 RepID=A0AA48RDP2_9ZZZZ